LFDQEPLPLDPRLHQPHVLERSSLGALHFMALIFPHHQLTELMALFNRGEDSQGPRRGRNKCRRASPLRHMGDRYVLENGAPAWMKMGTGKSVVSCPMSRR
jgi:hypothetical protein